MIKVLLVDSDTDYLARAQHQLARQELDIQTADNAQVALHMLWQTTPDIVVATAELPQISGWAFCRLLKSSPLYAHLPFIILGDEVDGEGAVKALKLGAEDYLFKSCSFAELAARIYKRVEKPDATAANTTAAPILTGHLGTLRLPDLLQFFSLQGESWTITLVNGPFIGQVLISAGIVLQAVSGFLHGKVAFEDLLNWQAGMFSVEPLIDIPPREMIGQTVESLLLEHATKSDELTRELASLATPQAA